MIRKSKEYLLNIINKLYSNYSSIKFNKKVFHTILKNDLSAELKNNEEEILFGCGCFWGAEKGFWRLPGIISTAVGYAGGEKDNPSYREVCTGQTGHAEVVQISFDTKKINYQLLLDWFWRGHDPTTLNRQGGDVGTQYRSVIFFHNKVLKG